jgi:uncharacterized OB-fold protein
MKPSKEMTLGERLRKLRGSAAPPQTGWVCPKCGSVYSPRAFECFNCNRPALEVIR